MKLIIPYNQKYLLIIITFTLLDLLFSVSGAIPISYIHENNNSPLTDCSLCIEMFDFQFNCDEYIKRTASFSNINSNSFIKDKAKDISVKFFLKSMEFLEPHKQCTFIQYGTKDKACDTIKEDYCTEILGTPCNKADKNTMSFMDVNINTYNNVNQFVPYQNIATNNNSDYNNNKVIQYKNEVVGSQQPVMFDNFQSNIGDQLKEIEILTKEVTSTKNKLKELKHKLSNKLEIVQSSYNAIQKTLSDISKMVNENNSNNIIHNNKHSIPMMMFPPKRYDTNTITKEE